MKTVARSCTLARDESFARYIYHYMRRKMVRLNWQTLKSDTCFDLGRDGEWHTCRGCQHYFWLQAAKNRRHGFEGNLAGAFRRGGRGRWKRRGRLHSIQIRASSYCCEAAAVMHVLKIAENTVSRPSAFNSSPRHKVFVRH